MSRLFCKFAISVLHFCGFRQTVRPKRAAIFPIRPKALRAGRRHSCAETVRRPCRTACRLTDTAPFSVGYLRRAPRNRCRTRRSQATQGRSPHRVPRAVPGCVPVQTDKRSACFHTDMPAGRRATRRLSCTPQPPRELRTRSARQPRRC